jgi:LuxR family transcriptional regulator, quorum-sensing system regulator BjaR1
MHASVRHNRHLTEPVGRSSRSRPSAVEFYRALQECRDIDACAALFKTFVAAYNVDVFACGEVDLDNKDLTVFHIIEWPEKFRKFYHAANLVERDWVVEGLRHFNAPYTWTDLRRQRTLDPAGAETVRRLVRQYGWRDGLVVPIPRGGTCYGLVSLVGRSPLLSAQSRTHLSLASECLLARIRAFGPPHTFPAPPSGLTRREINALRLVALGYTDADIAESMGVSQITAHQHVEGARKRLRARSRASMVAKGMTLGIVWLGCSQFDPSKA